MPKKGKGNTKRNASRRSKTTKSPQKSSKQSNRSNNSNSPLHKPSSKRQGQAFSKEILPLLNKLTSVLREVDQLKGNPLYETAIKLDEICDNIMSLQSGTKRIPKRQKPNIWGFEDTQHISDPQIILDRLTLWIKSQQKDTFMSDKFAFAGNLSEGRGVIATKDLHQGEHVMSIHRKLMMSHSYAINKSDDKIRRFLKKDALCKQVSSLSLALFVWYERMKGKRSFWKPYLDALPVYFGLPHEANTKDLVPFLSGSLILDKIIRLKISHLRHYTYSRQMLHRAGIEPGLRLIDYLWSVGAVMTRQNRIPSEIDCNISEIALIPGWDMCNYKSGKITTYFNTKQQKNEMFLMNDTEKGKQIYIYYGSQRNELLYLNSGFVFNDNINDEIELNLALDIDDPLYNIKSLQIKNAKLSNPMSCLLPVLHYDRYQGDEIVLDVDIADDDAKRTIDTNAKEISNNKSEVETFADDDVCSAWILSVFKGLGLSIPPPSIRFARIYSMNKEELMEFMQKFYDKKKQNKAEIISEEVVDLENVDAKDERIKTVEEIGEPKELISVGNELKAWHTILGEAERMYRFFTDKLRLCVAVHIDGDNVDGDDDNESEMKQFDSKEVLRTLIGMNKHYVALSFDLLDIERNHYTKTIQTMKKGISIIENRLNRVLKGNHTLNIDVSRVVSL